MIVLITVLTLLGILAFAVPAGAASDGDDGSDDGGNDGDGDDGGSGDSGGDDSGDDGGGLSEEAKEAIKEIKDDYKRELDKYRNEVGQLKKKLKEKEKENMSEEEKLEAEREELKEKERELRRKELSAHKAEQVAENELDSRLSEFIDVEQLHKANPDLDESDIEQKIEDMKAAQDAIREEVIDELKEGGSVLDSVLQGGKGGENNNKGQLGKKLAQSSSESDSEAVEAQGNYFNN